MINEITDTVVKKVRKGLWRMPRLTEAMKDCGEHGDVIDFAARLFGLPLYVAAQRLAADFHLPPDKPPSAAALHAKRIRTEAQQLRENERLCFSVLSDYARVLRNWKVQYAPQSPDKPVHARFVGACHDLDQGRKRRGALR